jgi:hypothetical protein
MHHNPVEIRLVVEEHHHRNGNFVEVDVVGLQQLLDLFA